MSTSMRKATPIQEKNAEMLEDSSPPSASLWAAGDSFQLGVRPPAPLTKWEIGFLSVDLKGRPILDKSKTGGWRAAPFIFGSECAEKMVYFTVLTNFITYLMFAMHNSYQASNTILSNWAGTVNITPLIGAFIADSYLGRFWTICVFTNIYFVGIIVLTIQATASDLHPTVACSIVQLSLGQCPPSTKQQMAVLYAALYVVALGAGGIRPLVAPFGADQFDVYDPKEKRAMSVFFNMFYLFFTAGILFAVTVVAYISDHYGWGWGFGCLAMAMAISNASFFLGAPLYRHKLPSGSPLTRVSQVLWAAFSKRSLALPINPAEMYEVHDKESAIVGSGKLMHTPDYRFLDKAAIETSEDKLVEGTISPWRLCTVTQVEELKAMFNLLPVWFTCIFLNTIFVQIASLSVLQAMTMDRNLGPHITLPPASSSAFSVLIVIASIPAYDRIYVPLMRRLTGNERGTTILQRIGAGYFISIFSVLLAGFVEHRRRQIVQEHPHDPLEPGPPPYSVFWLVFQFTFLGLAEVFAGIGQIELFYDQAPDGMRGVGGALLALAAAAGSYLSTLLVRLVQDVTARGDNPGWLADNINAGRLDYYYWLMSVIATLNFLAFLVVSRRYSYKVQAERTIRIDGQPALGTDEQQSL